MKCLAGLMIGIAGLAMAEPNALPYDEFTKFSEKMPGEKIDGELLIPAYLKPRTAGEKIDLAVANFRIQMPDGKSVPLKCEQMPVIPEAVTNLNDKKKIVAGFTHKLWIPKDPAKYAGAAMLNDLPKDFLEIQFPLPPREP
jgi:hypothetical protein